METTHNLGLPYIMPSQAQKHVTHNEALRMLDALVQLSVQSRGLAAPPVDAGDGARYLVAAPATGAWQGWEDSIAAFIDGGWLRFQPKPGWRAWIADEEQLVAWTGAEWRSQTGGDAAFASVGIGTAADTGNRLSVKSDAVLFSHDDVAPGSGDMRLSLNKSASANDAGIVFQRDWSTRALFGLLGNDDFEIKLSPDGIDFTTSLKAGSADGKLKIGGDPFMNFAALNIQGRALTGTGNSWFGICVTQTSDNNTPKGGAVLVGAPYANANNPFMVLGPWATSGLHQIYYGGGGWGVPDATSHAFYTSAYNPTTNNTGTVAFSIEHAAITAARQFRPSIDNSFSLGASGFRWSVVWAATGTINTSDARLKQVEGTVPLGLDFVNALEPVAYRWKTGGHDIAQKWIDDPQGKPGEDGKVAQVLVDVPVPKPGRRTHFGLVAQQVKEKLAVFGIQDFAGWTLADRDDPDSEQGLRYDQFVPILVRAVQELSQSNAALAARVDELEGQLS